MNLKQLAKRVASELEPDDKGECYLQIDRRWIPEKTRGLRRVTVEALGDLKERVDRAIPNEFQYGMIFEDGALMFGLEFLDGDHHAAGFAYPLNPNHSALQVAAELRKVDWEERRLKAIQGANLHDEIADLAEDYPAEWIPTSVIHEAYCDEVDAYLEWLASEGQLSGVLAANIEEGLLMNCTVDGPEQRDVWISQQMGQGNLILAVVENGTLLSPIETDILRRVELEKLPKIAKAKAEGRYWAAFEAMDENQFSDDEDE